MTAKELFCHNPIAAAMLKGTMIVSRAAAQRAVLIAKPAKPDPVASTAARQNRWTSSSLLRQGMSR